MPYTTLISTDDLARYIDSEDWLIIDARADLMDVEKGRQQYETSHIPHAIFADLESDLSGPIISGVTGRHPLPELSDFSKLLSSWGVNENAQVIVYDDMKGMIAARLWWMLRWLGHEKVAVLDGGWSKWVAEDRPVNDIVEPTTARVFTSQEQNHLIANSEEALVASQNKNQRLLDARAKDRFSGESEPFDSVAGHIPGAISAPCMNNIGNNGCLLDQESLRQLYATVLDGVESKDTIIYCGSGVSAAHNILAILHAGLGDCKLYPGSWSHWITDAENAVATGDK